MSNNVSYTFENGIASIAMDDGKANALSHQMWFLKDVLAYFQVALTSKKYQKDLKKLYF